MDRSEFIEGENGLRTLLNTPQPDYITIPNVLVRYKNPTSLEDQELPCCYIGYGATRRISDADTLAEAVKFQFIVPVTLIVGEPVEVDRTLVHSSADVQDLMDFVVNQMRNFPPDVPDIILEDVYVNSVDPTTGGLSNREALHFQIVFVYQDLSHI